jgi:hypothetical protein
MNALSISVVELPGYRLVAGPKQTYPMAASAFSLEGLYR